MKDLKNTSMPELTVPKFTKSNFESFMENLKSAVSCLDRIRWVPIDCFLREVNGNYNDKWESRRDKLSNCLSFAGNQFKHESDLTYHLYIQYIDTEVHGSNILKKYTRINNCHNIHRDFCGRYIKKAYLSNKATEA